MHGSLQKVHWATLLHLMCSAWLKHVQRAEEVACGLKAVMRGLCCCTCTWVIFFVFEHISQDMQMSSKKLSGGCGFMSTITGHYGPLVYQGLRVFPGWIRWS